MSDDGTEMAVPKISVVAAATSTGTQAFVARLLGDIESDASSTGPVVGSQDGEGAVAVGRCEPDPGLKAPGLKTFT